MKKIQFFTHVSPTQVEWDMGIFLRFCLFFVSLSALASEQQALELRQRIEVKSTPKARAYESFKLPVSRPFDQKDSQLCWVHSFMSALETLHLERHPDEKLELSRAYFQYRNMQERMGRLIESGEEFDSERGTPVDAFELAKTYGLVEFKNYHGLVGGIDSRYSSVRRSIKKAKTNPERYKILNSKLKSLFGEFNVELNPAMNEEVLAHQEWTAYAPGKHEGWGIHPDPDARPGQRAYYLSMDQIENKIYEALKAGIPVTYGGNGHSILIYGAEYNEEGKALQYLIKDSYGPYFYKAEARSTHASLIEVSFPSLNN